MNCRKANHHEKQLKSLKPKRSGTKSEKKICRAGPGSKRNFNFSFGTIRARSKFLSLFGVGPGLKNPARADL